MIKSVNNYLNYLLSALRIFILTFLLGKGIDKIFEKINKKYSEFNKNLIGLIQLFFIINIAYYLHIFTSENFSNEFQISHPSILFSSFIINLQTNMFRNLGVS